MLETTDCSDRPVPDVAFSPDGKLIAYYLPPNENDDRVKVAVMSVGDRQIWKSFSIADQKSRPVEIAWAGDNKSFYYITTKPSRNSLWQQYLEDENQHLICDLGNEAIAHLVVSPDGASFGIIRGRWIHDAVLIEGLK